MQEAATFEEKKQFEPDEQLKIDGRDDNDQASLVVHRNAF